MASCWLLHREVKTRKDLSRKPVLWSMFYSNSAALRSGAAMLAGVKYVLGHKQLYHPPSLLILQCCWVAFASGGSSQLIRFLSTGCVILLSGPYLKVPFAWMMVWKNTLEIAIEENLLRTNVGRQLLSQEVAAGKVKSTKNQDRNNTALTWSPRRTILNTVLFATACV